jgi:hypothetical protein
MKYAKFNQLLNHYPFAQQYFDLEAGECDVYAIKKAAGMIPTQSSGLSRGERLVLQFLGGVWLGENEFEFDFIDAVGALDDTHLEPILNWAAKPCWP